MPLVQHDPGRPLITDEAYALSHTRILQEPSRAAAPTSPERRQLTVTHKRKNVKSKGGKRHPQSLETIQPNAAGIDLGSRRMGTGELSLDMIHEINESIEDHIEWDLYDFVSFFWAGN